MAIDLNADIGGGVGEEAVAREQELLTVVSSANVACGGHAGDAGSMQRVVELAAATGVAIGAHVSYLDRAHFGRSPEPVEASALQRQIVEQIAALDACAESAGTRVTYIKPHGALYHRACTPGTDDAEVVIASALEYASHAGRQLAILGFAGSYLVDCAREAGLKAFNEAFADRRYTPQGWLVDRSLPDSVITNPTEALSRLKRLLRDREIVAVDGTPIDVKADSICIHGDTPGAVILARRLRASIDADRVKIAPFAPPPAVRST